MCRPCSARQSPPIIPTDDPPDRRDESLNQIIPDNPNQPYDMHEVIAKLVDEGDFMEIQPGFAGNILIGFARIDGSRT